MKKDIRKQVSEAVDKVLGLKEDGGEFFRTCDRDEKGYCTAGGGGGGGEASKGDIVRREEEIKAHEKYKKFREDRGDDDPQVRGMAARAIAASLARQNGTSWSHVLDDTSAWRFSSGDKPMSRTYARLGHAAKINAFLKYHATDYEILKKSK